MTSLKGGTLILDFKDEEEITYEASTPTILKRNYLEIIKKAKGKHIRIINLKDNESDFNENVIIESSSYQITGNVCNINFSYNSENYGLSLSYVGNELKAHLF